MSISNLSMTISTLHTSYIYIYTHTHTHTHTHTYIYLSLPYNSIRKIRQYRRQFYLSIREIWHYRQIYLDDRPDPIAFMPVAVDTSGRVYDDFNRLLSCMLTSRICSR